MLSPLPIALLCLLAPQGPADPPPLDVATALESAVAAAIARAEGSVVAITREKEARGEETLAVRGRPQAAPNFELGQPPDLVATDFGSGVVVGDDGQILTAFHVVKGASQLVVRAAGRQQFFAEVIAADPRSDLAVIAPRELGGAQPPPKLTPIPLGDASKLRKGAFLISLGNPFNAGRDGSASASLGILANVARRVEASDDDIQKGARQLRNFPTLLQLDAKLNLGMSGGAVINLKGELVGLTTIAANASGFDAQAGYAVPIDALGRRVVEALRDGREAEYGFLGIQLARDGDRARISSLQPGSPADDAGLLADDQIVAVAGRPIFDSETLIAAVNSFPPGRPIPLKVVRRDQPIEKVVVLSKYPTRGEVIATNRPAPWRGLRVDYLSRLPETQLGGPLLSAMARGGVAIVEVAPGSAADLAGLRPNQIIRRVDGKAVKSPAEFARLVAGLEGPVELATEADRVVVVK